MDVLIICPEADFRRNINLNAVEREMGTSTVTFGDLLRHLAASSPSLRTLNRTNELVFHYINQDGRLVPVRAGDSVRRYTSYQTFFLQSVGSRAVTSLPSYPNSPQQSPVRSRAPAKRGIWITGLLALFLILSVWGISSHLGSTTSPAGTASSAPTSTSTEQSLPIQDSLINSSALNNYSSDDGCSSQSDGFHDPSHTCAYSDQSIGDADITVTAKLIKGADGGDPVVWYGIIFREGDGFFITSDGKWDAGYYETYFYNSPFNAAIQQGVGATNTLQVQMQGSHFTFLVNGVNVGTWDDTSASPSLSGRIGFIVESTGGSAEAVFTNLLVTKNT